MIGSHNTFTYLDSTNCLYNKAKRWWKCQGKNIQEQYNFGIRFFDIRIFWNKNKWRACHGKVNLTKTWSSLRDICTEMKDKYPDAIYRIVLEKGDPSEFHNQINEKIDGKNLIDTFPNLWRLDAKELETWNGVYGDNNQSLYDRGYKFAYKNVWEYPAHELHGFLTWKNFYKMNLKKEAKKINNKLGFFKDKNELKEMIEDKTTLYFLDYCTNEY